MPETKKEVEAKTKLQDLRDANAAMDRCKTELASHGGLSGTIGYPSQFWTDMNFYRGMMSKYGLS